MIAMKIASVAAAGLIAAFAITGTASAKEKIVPHVAHAAKASPRVAEPKRPAKTPLLDFTSTRSINGIAAKTSDQRKTSTAPSGVMANPWIVPNIH
jgi:hypothetical protein